MRVCPICFRPNCNHHSKYIEIDDEILDTIRILNEKGYVTEFCCAGHLDNINPVTVYIKFNTSAVLTKQGKLPKTLPSDKWVCYPRHIENHHLVWSKKLSLYQGSAMYYFVKDWRKRKVDSVLAELEEARKELYEWAKGLE